MTLEEATAQVEYRRRRWREAQDAVVLALDELRQAEEARLRVMAPVPVTPAWTAADEQAAEKGVKP